MKKKSAKKAAVEFCEEATKIEAFLERVTEWEPSDEGISWAHEYAIIRLYREFEKLILNCLVAAINNDTEQLSRTTGVGFPKHLTDEVCEYIIVGDSFFDFRGRSGLIQTLKKYLPDDHYLVVIVKADAYRNSLDCLARLRNFAAHDSKVSKKHARLATNSQRLASAGAWLKRQNRFGDICGNLSELANEVHEAAPY